MLTTPDRTRAVTSRPYCTSEAVISDHDLHVEPAAAPARRLRILGNSFNVTMVAVVLAIVILLGWTMHSGRGGGLGLIPIGKNSGDLNAAVTVSADFPKMSLEIPAQNVKAPIDPEGVVDGELQIPPNVHRVGWYKDGGGLDSGPGAVLITGHVNWAGQGTGALGNIGQLHVGDVVITRGQDKPQAWRITRLVSYIKAYGLPQDIFRNDGKRELVLVTCGGAYDPKARSYLSNIVVHAQPVTTLLN